MRDTSKIHDEIHVSQMHPERDVSDMKETCGIHARYMRDTCILRGNQDTCGIHAGYMRDTCGIHAGHVSRGFGGMYRCHHGEQRTYQATHVLLVQKWVLSSTLQLLHLLLCHGHPYPCWFTALVEREAQQLLLLSTERFEQGAGPYVSSNVSLCIRHVS